MVKIRYLSKADKNIKSADGSNRKVTYYSYDRRIPVAFQPALRGKKFWRIALGSDEAEAIVACRRLTAKHDALIAKDPREVAESELDAAYQREVVVANELGTMFANLRAPEAIRKFDEASLWTRTTAEMASCAKLPDKHRVHRLKIWRTTAFNRKPGNPAMHGVWQTQLDALSAEIEALQPDTITLGVALEQLISFRQLRGSTPRKYRAHINRFANHLGGDVPIKSVTKDVKWSQKTGQRAKVCPEPLKGYESGEAPEVYRPV